MHGAHFPGKVIPFRSFVYFMFSPTRDTRDKAEPSLRPGIFMGYRMPPGGQWDGDYLVCDIDDFMGFPFHIEAEPGLFKHCKPHVTRTVKHTTLGPYFPLFDKYIEHNETIQGIDIALTQIAQEKCRRKRLKIPEVCPKIADQLDEMDMVRRITPDVPATAGYDVEVDIPAAIPNAEEGSEKTDEIRTLELLLRQQMIGGRCQIKGLPARSKFNGATGVVENFDNVNQMFEVRLDTAQVVVKAPVDEVHHLPDEEEAEHVVEPAFQEGLQPDGYIGNRRRPHGADPGKTMETGQLFRKLL